MKNLLICATLAVLGGALVGCGSGDDAPLDPKDQLAEMNAKVPPGTEPFTTEEATKGMQVMGGGKKGTK